MGELWPLAAVTTPWQISGTDFPLAQRVALGEFAELPGLMQLPDRGVGADAVGRTAARLAAVSRDLAVETTPSGWRLTAAPGRDVRRAASTLGQDLDVLEELSQGYVGPLVVGLVGPWTLAARIERSNGERLIGDLGATRELSAAMVDVVSEIVSDLRRRVPGARPVIRFDEPDVTPAIQGRLTTQSGWGRARSVAITEVESTWRLLRPSQDAMIGVRATGIDPALVARAGFDLLWADLNSGADPDQLGQWFDDGGRAVFELPLADSPDRIGRAVGQLATFAGHVGLDLERLLMNSALAPTPCDCDDLAGVGARFAELTRAIRDEVDK